MPRRYNKTKILVARILSRFELRGVKLDHTLHSKLIKAIVQQFICQNRKLLTDKFIVEATARYLKVSPDTVRIMFRFDKGTRFGLHLPRKRNYSSLNDKQRLIKILARKETQPSRYVVVSKQQGQTTPLKQRMQYRDPSLYLMSPKDFTLTPRKQHGFSATGTPYKRTLSGSSGEVFRLLSPIAATTIPLDKGKIPATPIRQRLQAKPEYFEFTVTPQIIEQRLNQRRPCSQRQVTGYSAKEFFQALGIEVRNRAHGSFYHLAHRHGFALGGAQSDENLDPATEGSNYTTLFYIENPIAKMLTQVESQANVTDSFHVSVRVYNHPSINIPQQITYRVSWGGGRYVEKTINPLSFRRPTLTESHLSLAFFRSQRTPEKDDKIRPSRGDELISPRNLNLEFNLF